METPRPNDIFQADFCWKNCCDARPCVILSLLPDEKVQVMPLSAQMDLYKKDTSLHFLLEQGAPDFCATGLKKTCYVVGPSIYELGIRKLQYKRGCLQGELATLFKKWLG